MISAVRGLFVGMRFAIVSGYAWLKVLNLVKQSDLSSLKIASLCGTVVSVKTKKGFNRDKSDKKMSTTYTSCAHSNIDRNFFGF